MTRIDIKICRIDRICDTSSNSVSIDWRIRKILLGNGVFFISTVGVSVVVDDSTAILLITAKSNAGITGCLATPLVAGKSAVCLISDENSSRRVPIKLSISERRRYWKTKINIIKS